MNEPQVDLSAIRGDWYFHMNYVTNAMGNTLSRVRRLWAEIGPGLNVESLGELVAQQGDMWSALTEDLDAKGVVKTDSEAYLDFIKVCRSTQSVCAALEEAHGASGSSSARYDTPLEQLTEACRQARALCADLELMREQRPDT